MNALNTLLGTLLRWTLRALLLAMGLVFALSLTVVVLLLGLTWALRALWARLWGQPVRAWSVKFGPREGWDLFARRSGGASPDATRLRPGPAAEVIDVEVKRTR